MAIDFTNKIYLLAQNTYSVDCTFNPLKSQPGMSAYASRGIYDTRPMDVMGEDGSIISEQQTIFDIREAEYAVLPIQGDRVNIPFDCNGAALGDFEIMDADTNGGGETTLVIRKIMVAKP
jgi:hypothetical protein